jgi:hypothetical protein
MRVSLTAADIAGALWPPDASPASMLAVVRFGLALIARIPASRPPQSVS